MVYSFNAIPYLSSPVISDGDVTKYLTKLKNNKAPGPDNIKPDLYKILNKSIMCKTALANSLNNLLQEETEVPVYSKNQQTHS